MGYKETEWEDDGTPIDSILTVIGWDTVTSVFMTVKYTIVRCGSTTSISITSFRLFDNSNYYLTMYPTRPSTTPCTFNPADYYAYKDQLLTQLAAIYGNPLEVVYPTSCNSLVIVQWPSGAYIYNPPSGDSGGTATVTPLTMTYELVPCDKEICCRVLYKFNSRGIPTILSSTGAEGCIGATFKYEPIEISTTDSMGNPIIYTGTILNASECSALCNSTQPTGFYKTDIMHQVQKSKSEKEKEIPLEFRAAPTLVNEFIQFSTSEPIVRIEIYDSKGRKVLTTNKLNENQLNTKDLERGIHFIRVYFSETELKTIKIVKQ